MNKSGALDAKNAFYVQWSKQKIVFISIPSFMMVFWFSFSTEFTPLFCISSVIWSAFLQGSFCYLILVVDQFHFGNFCYMMKITHIVTSRAAVLIENGTFQIQIEKTVITVFIVRTY